MNYVISKYDSKFNTYRIKFDDNRWINIDLVNNFPNYHIIYNTYDIPLWFYISQDNKNIIKKFNTLDLRKISTKHNKITMDGILYKIANQTEYDKYNKNSEDNNKLYLYLEKLWTTPNLKVTIV